MNQCEGSYLIVEVGRRGGQDAAVGLEHLSLDVDGKVTEAAVLSLLVEAAEHRGLSAGEAHLHHRVARDAAAAHLHGQRLLQLKRKERKNATFLTFLMTMAVIKQSQCRPPPWITVVMWDLGSHW